MSQITEGLDVGNGPRGEDERENSLVELRAERHRLESVVLMMPAPVALHLGPEHRYVLANDAYQRVSGAHRQLIGRTPRELFPEVAASGVFEIFDRVYVSGEPWVSPETLLPFDRDGSGRVRSAWFNVRLEPLRDAEERVIGILNYSLEITDEVRARKSMERLLDLEQRAREAAEDAYRSAERARERTARLQALTAALSISSTRDEVADAVVHHTTEAFGAAGTVITLVSEDGAWLDLVDAIDMPENARAEWRRFPVSASAPLSDAVRTGEPIYLESRAAWTERYSHLLSTLEPSGHHANAVVPLRVEGRALGALGVAFGAPRGFDLEDRALALAIAQLCAQALDRARLLESERAARAQAEDARAAAEAASRAKSEFLAVMSHELRTPLNAIGGYAELIDMGIHGPVTAEQREDLQRVQASQRHLLGLINEVLNYARVETGRVNYHIQKVRVRDALAGAETLVSPQAEAKGLELTVAACPPDLACSADPEKVRQILVNLLSNAVKFTSRGGRIDLACGTDDQRAHITVSDTGIGISPDQLERIFDPFVQVRSDLTRTAEGVGLGLAISRDLARGMGGDLTVESTPGAGSTFTLVLPRA